MIPKNPLGNYYNAIVIRSKPATHSFCSEDHAGNEDEPDIIDNKDTHEHRNK